ncbi:oxygenase MpaB family protein [Nocardia yamanashiensis]|uniref:oxygenase MpaB family protein n=1 Tax=Nocardia yamanashiensis TaxID=209247 RepID=UPI000A9427F6|nr:oxygenase MpaB family protein [Nocardia yamanashiensis]
MVAYSAMARDPRPDPEPLGPDSLTWRIFGSVFYAPTGLFIGMVQNMHPGLGAGVEFHSEIQDEFYQRVMRSLYPIAGVVYDGPRARQTAREIVGYHRTIKGVDGQGRRYHALDPGTFYWAHAVFFMQTVRAAELFMGGLDDREREQLWREHCQWYELYGMSMRVVPASWAEFQRYWNDMCRNTLEPTKAAWEVYRLAENAPVPPFPVLRQLPQPLWRWVIRPSGARFYQFVTVGMCDPAIRRTMGFTWTARDQWMFDRICRALTALNRVTPDEVRYALPRVRAARRRVTGKRPAWMPPPEAPESLWPAPEHRDDPKHYCPVHASGGRDAVTTFRQLTGF